MTTSSTAGLDGTATAGWYARLTNAGTGERPHWRTKVAYYQALAGLIAAGRRDLSWRVVVAAVQPHGSRTTFYDVTGRSAKYPLYGALAERRAGPYPDLLDLYRRSDPIAQLTDEAKVWSVWPYRQGWLRQITAEPIERAAAADALIEVTAQWARRHPALARAADCVPPLCVLEDLLALTGAGLDAVHGYRLLADLIGRVDSAYVDVVAGATESVRRELRSVSARQRRFTPEDLVAGLAIELSALALTLAGLDPTAADRTRAIAVELLRGELDRLTNNRFTYDRLGDDGLGDDRLTNYRPTNHQSPDNQQDRSLFLPQMGGAK